MNTAQPIRDKAQLERFKDYYRLEEPNSRNYLFIITSLNTALHVSDVLKLQWRDVYDFNKKAIRAHLSLREEKTEKNTVIFINGNIREALQLHIEAMAKIKPEEYLFAPAYRPDKPISRVQAYRIIQRVKDACGMEGVVSSHSLRKTFGYQACRQGVNPSMLMDIFNHSSYSITKRYLGIEQDERDEVFRDISV